MEEKIMNMINGLTICETRKVLNNALISLGSKKVLSIDEYYKNKDN